MANRFGIWVHVPPEDQEGFTSKERDNHSIIRLKVKEDGSPSVLLLKHHLAKPNMFSVDAVLSLREVSIHNSRISYAFRVDREGEAWEQVCAHSGRGELYIPNLHIRLGLPGSQSEKQTREGVLAPMNYKGELYWTFRMTPRSGYSICPPKRWAFDRGEGSTDARGS